MVIVSMIADMFGGHHREENNPREFSSKQIKVPGSNDRLSTEVSEPRERSNQKTAFDDAV